MKDSTKLLPIGSVVMLKEGTKEVMITGFYSVPENDKNKIYDYCGCLFPEGVMSSNENLLFNHDQIANVLYMGFSNQQEKEFKQKLASAFSVIEKIG